MSFMKKLFGKKNKFDFVSPVKGELVPIENVKDEMFSTKVLGDGYAVVPTEKKGFLVSPVNGKIMTLFPTKHAFGIVTEDNKEILVHFGIDTVQNEGKNIEAIVEEGKDVKAGDKILEIDFEQYINDGYDVTVIVIVSNDPEYKFENLKLGDIEIGESVFKE